MNGEDQVLAAAEAGARRDTEIARVLRCHDHDYFAVLEVDAFSSDFSLVVRKQFRKKSLLIHPDKSDHPDAPRAFDLLKKAQLALSAEGDDDKTKILVNERQRLVDMYKHAKELAKRSEKKGDRRRQEASVENDVRRILDDELAHETLENVYKQRQEASEREAHEKQKQEREEKKKHAVQWEDERDSRVSNWRQYLYKNKKRPKDEGGKKKKRKVLA